MSGTQFFFTFWELAEMAELAELAKFTESILKLASFKADRRPYRSSAANHVGAAVLAYVARSGRLDAAHRWTKPYTLVLKIKTISKMHFWEILWLNLINGPI